MPVLSVTDLAKKYVVHGGYEVPALNGVSFDLHPGEMLGLFGPNGVERGVSLRRMRVNGLAVWGAGRWHRERVSGWRSIRPRRG